MKEKKRSNPLRHRIIHEIQDDWQKYLVIALFLTLIIGFVSAVYVANGSMLAAGDKAPQKYLREDGHFELYEEADKTLLNKLEEKESVTIYKNYYRDQAEKPDKLSGGREKLTKEQRRKMRIRLFPVREKIDLACVMKGRLPESDDEVAIDRMHADNVGLHVGDKLTAGKQSFTICGLISSSDYTTLFEHSSDVMFDALTFDVGVVTQGGFDRLSSRIHYNYSYIHTTAPGNARMDRPADEEEEKERSDAFVETLLEETALSGNRIEAFVPAYANQSIQFALDDFGADKAMAGVILYVLVAILAFVFAITISSTITTDSMVIGTLRASGYGRGELIRHYMVTPVIITVIAAVIGNILGYTVLKKAVAAMYYNSYSLPSYETVPSSEAFLKTTIVPIILMFVINLIIITKKMQHTPLQFLRRELKKQRRGHALRLPGFSFLSRFRLRVILQNIPGYFILFVGISCVMIMLAMAVGMPDSLRSYKKRAPELTLADHQVMIKNYRDETGAILNTEEKSAEPFAVEMLYHKGKQCDEDIEAYGVMPESDYVTDDRLEDLEEDEVLISSCYADKFRTDEGDTIKLYQKYSQKAYKFKVAGIYDYEAGSSVFMPIGNLRELFDMDAEAFNGWFSDKKITDIGERYIVKEITAENIRAMVNQLDHSLGSFMEYFQYLCIALSAVLIFMLTKLIIQRNENAISMTKILGYTNREISSIYLVATTIVVIVSEIAAIFIGYKVMQVLWRLIMERMDGWFAFTIAGTGFIKMFIFVFIGYLIVLFFDYRRIRKVPMDEALKMME